MLEHVLEGLRPTQNKLNECFAANVNHLQHQDEKLGYKTLFT